MRRQVALVHCSPAAATAPHTTRRGSYSLSRAPVCCVRALGRRPLTRLRLETPPSGARGTLAAWSALATRASWPKLCPIFPTLKSLSQSAATTGPLEEVGAPPWPRQSYNKQPRKSYKHPRKSSSSARPTECLPLLAQLPVDCLRPLSSRPGTISGSSPAAVGWWPSFCFPVFSVPIQVSSAPPSVPPANRGPNKQVHRAANLQVATKLEHSGR